MLRPAAPAFVTLLVAATIGCHPPDAGVSARSECQPIVAPGGGTEGACFLPFPSSYYLRADATTGSGFRVALPTGVLPKNQIGKDFDVTRLNRLDGFSPATQLVADLGARLDPKRLPSQSDHALSATAQSTVQILEYATGARVPLFAELDHNVVDSCSTDMDCHGGATCHAGACSPLPAQVLLIHPHIRLRPATRYVVALVGMKDLQGNPVTPGPFRALTEGNVPSGSPLEAVKPRYAEIFTLLENNGVPRTSLSLAWDFVTASDRQITDHMLAIRDAGFKRWQAQNLGFTITDSLDQPADSHLLRELKGTFAVPSFLKSNTDLGADLALDDQGLPIDTGTNYDANLLIHVPRCALTASKPLPIMVYGHGFFGAADEINADYQKAMIDSLCMVQVATDWVGLDSADSVVVPIKVFGSFDTFWLPTDRLQQGVLNTLVLARLAARKLKDARELTVNGKPIADGTQVYYLGASQGGILGNTVLALSPDITHGALNVGAGAYSLMLTRSADFTNFKSILNYTYPVQRDQEILLALSQSYWDFTDPIRYVDRALHDPFSDPDTGKAMAPKFMLLQESRGDGQVPNVATRVVARTAGLPLLAPAVEPLAGIEEKTGPLDSAYTQWDVRPMPFPADENVPPKDNPAHEAIRRLPQLQEQLRQFFQPGGRIVQTCAGPCRF